MGLAIALGSLVGIERDRKGRPAGLRTHMLVCMASCLVMITGQYTFELYGVGDPARLGAQVVSGIGFLGIGSILVTRDEKVKGLTTAAGLWASAAVGLSLGIGLYEPAVLGCLAICIIERFIRGSRHNDEQ